MAKRQGRSTTRNVFFKNTEMNFTVLRALFAARFGGSTLGECLTVVNQVRDGDEVGMHAAWMNLGHALAERAQQAAEQADQVRAREFFLRAANYYKSAMIILNPRDPRHKTAWDLSRRNFELAGAYFTPPLQVVKVPYENKHLACYFLAAHPAERRPTLMIVTGGEGSNLESYFWAGAYALEQGYNVFLYEGPGNISTVYESGFTFIPQAEIPIGTAIDSLLTFGGVDPDRLALLGLSFGGYMVGRAAAHDPRIRAVIPDSPVRNFYKILTAVLPPQVFSLPEGLLVFLKDHLMEYSDRATLDNLLWEGGISTFRQMADGLPAFTIEGMETQITCPTLALAGEGEGAEFLGQAREFFDLISSKTKRFRVFTAAEGAGAHCQADNTLLMNQELMAWLAEVFQA